MLTPNYRSVARHIATLLFSASAAFAITGGLDEPTMSQSVLMLATLRDLLGFDYCAACTPYGRALRFTRRNQGSLAG